MFRETQIITLDVLYVACIYLIAGIFLGTHTYFNCVYSTQYSLGMIWIVRFWILTDMPLS